METPSRDELRGRTVEPAAKDVHLMARLLVTHMLLSHRGGEDWYEVHPLTRRALGLP